MFENQKINDRNKNLNDIKKYNPQALPPAGKNFYDFNNKAAFLAAQKYGSITISPDKNDSLMKYIKSPGVNGLKEPKKRSGKRRFPEMANFQTPFANNNNFQIETPPKSYGFDEDFSGYSVPNYAKTVDYRYQNEALNQNRNGPNLRPVHSKPPMNPNHNFSSHDKHRLNINGNNQNLGKKTN